MNTTKARKHLIKMLFVPFALALSMSSLPYASADGGGTYSAYNEDREGYLDRAEFEKFAEAKRKRSSVSDVWEFDSVDADGDG